MNIFKVRNRNSASFLFSKLKYLKHEFEILDLSELDFKILNTNHLDTDLSRCLSTLLDHLLVEFRDFLLSISAPIAGLDQNSVVSVEFRCLIK